MASESSLKKHLWSVAGVISVFLLGQTVSGIYWAGSMNARMANAEGCMQRHDERIYRLEIGWASKPIDPAKPKAPNL